MKQTYLFRIDFWLRDDYVAAAEIGQTSVIPSCSAVMEAADRVEAIEKGKSLCSLRQENTIMAVKNSIIGILHDGILAE